ncbi:hypothetical protein ACFST9_05380 [Hymenobacter monticola]|uniref:Uncharacterized protein n=1 Tax=Hymenobacter monticola TaxID=1705399 RepID=A0ABY4BA50_9BACT|nr:hypothetical protein [Hymenobacter monticola]UOE36051.1 hypothetical protein MTP16_10515 [Hymenobacter monticola]
MDELVRPSIGFDAFSNRLAAVPRHNWQKVPNLRRLLVLGQISFGSNTSARPKSGRAFWPHIRAALEVAFHDRYSQCPGEACGGTKHFKRKKAPNQAIRGF